MTDHDYPITIHRGVPVPRKTYSFRAKYPWGKLDLGDMFLVHCPPEASQDVMRTLAASANAWCSSRDMLNQFVIRTTDEGVGAFRPNAEEVA
jgi:hypothetical protein